MLNYSIHPILKYFCPYNVRIAYNVKKKVSAESLAWNVEDI